MGKGPENCVGAGKIRQTGGNTQFVGKKKIQRRTVGPPGTHGIGLTLKRL
jgi:hypothetical protein